MSKNFKARIRDRYKGRGNCWVKLPKESEAYEKALELIQFPDAHEFINHVKREGFVWIRFSKPSGTKDEPRCLFELRYKGSKIDHPDCILDLSDSVAETLPFLGNTPVKLQLEINPSMRKVKQEKPELPKKRKNKKSNMHDIDDNETVVMNRLEVIQEAVLTKPTTHELKEWEAFLKAEDLLEYSI